MVYYSILFLLAIVPGVALLYFFKKSDRHQPEPWRIIWITFFLCVLLLFPVVFIEIFLESLTGWSAQHPQVSARFLHAIVGVALVEEFFKLLPVWIYAARKPEFDEMIDGLVYGAAAAAGFATVENIFYVLQHGFAIGIVRAILAVPMHLFTGALLGYGLALGKLQKKRFAPLLLFVLATLCHGIYDGVLFAGIYPWVAPLIVGGLLILVLVLGIRSLKLSHAQFGQQTVATSVVKKNVYLKSLYILMGILLLLFSGILALGFLYELTRNNPEAGVLVALGILIPLQLGGSGILFWRSTKR